MSFHKMMNRYFFCFVIIAVIVMLVV